MINLLSSSCSPIFDCVPASFVAGNDVMTRLAAAAIQRDAGRDAGRVGPSRRH